jgi:DNA polymerase delta subunit 1
VFAHVHGFTPYLYVPAPAGFEARHCDALRQGLCEAVRSRGRGEEKNLKHPCLGVTILRDKVRKILQYKHTI